MATTLRRLRLKRISLVDQPANEAARVVLFKSADGEAKKMQPTGDQVDVPAFARCKKCEAEMKGETKCSKCGDEMPLDAMKVASRPEEDKVDEKLKADLEAQVAALTKERDDLMKRLETPEEIEKRKLEALPESVRKQLVEQADEIAKMRSEKSEAEQIEKAKKDMPSVPGKHDDLGRLLKRVKDVVKAEDFEALATILKAASAQIEKGGLFREVGKRDSDPAMNPLARIEQLVSEKISKQADLKKSDAINQVLAEHPDLYAAYSRSVTVGASADAN